MAAQVYTALHPGVYLFSAQLQGGDPSIAATAQVSLLCLKSVLVQNF